MSLNISIRNEIALFCLLIPLYYIRTTISLGIIHVARYRHENDYHIRTEQTRLKFINHVYDAQDFSSFRYYN